MDEVIGALTTSHISLNEFDVSLTHPRYLELYKGKSVGANQEKRRKEWLQCLKRKREDHLNLSRGIHVKHSRGKKNSENGDSMEIDQIKKQKPVSREYKNYIMLSEWLIEVPIDLKENWICAICPVGLRALVVAEKRGTNAFARNGRKIGGRFQSWLPGGSEDTQRGKTILDAIYDFSTKTYYVLDVIYWGINTVELEAEMRFYWLKSKLEEGNSLLKKNWKSRQSKFVYLDHFPYNELQERMKTHPIYPGNNPKVDGILFYHREGTYVHSRSPLVTWLNPFMLPDILSIEVAPQYMMEEKPPNYQVMEVDSAEQASGVTEGKNMEA